MVSFDDTPSYPGTPGTPRNDPWMSDYNQHHQNQSNLEYSFNNHNEQTLDSQKTLYEQQSYLQLARTASSSISLPSPMLSPSSSLSFEQKIKLQLLEHPSIQNEMQLVAQNRIRLQQRPSSNGSSGQVGATAPCLFIILPTVSAATATTETTTTMSMATTSTTEEHQSDEQGQSSTLYHQTFSQDDFQLHFLCDYSDYEQLSKQLADNDASMDFEGSSPSPSSTAFSTPYPPMLHVCDEENGYRLKDLEDFCHIHKMCLLSLLRTLRSSLYLTSEQDYENSKREQQQQQQQQTQEQAGEMSSAESSQYTTRSSPSSLSPLQRRIDIAIRYMLQFFSMADLECILQSPSDVDMEDYDAEFMPSLRTQDFAESDIGRIMHTTTSDGRILGPLTQRNTRTAVRPSTPSLTGLGLVQWLCPHHAQVHCKAQAREHLKAVIVKNGGSCVEQERSAEIQFKTRDRAAEFYKLVLEYQCIVKLKIQIGWKDLTVDDLWDLAEVVTESNVGDLTLDCCCDSEGEVAHEATAAGNLMDQQRTNLSFKPFLGMLFSPNLASFTLENFSGLLPVLSTSNFTCSPTTFTLQGFRQSNPLEYNLPPFSNLRSLVLNRCGPEVKAQCLTELIRHCPHLTEIQLECDNIDASITQINEATNQMENITYLKLSESMWESVDMTFAKATTGGDSGQYSQHGHHPRSVLQRVNRKTLRSVDVEPQYTGVLEQFATCSFMNLWELHQTTLSNIIAQNPRLHSLELMCEARSMDMLWRFLTNHYQHHQQVRLQEQQFSQMNLHQSQTSVNSNSFLRLHLYDGTCSIITASPVNNVLTLHAYTPQHRQLIQSLEDVATTLGLSTKFDCPDQLALLQSHSEQDGGLRFENLTWILSPKQQNDPAFLLQLRSLVAANPQVKRFSIRVYVMLFDIQSLIQIWNWIVGDAYLNEGEHGRWIQACFEHSSQTSYNEFKSSSENEGGVATINNNNSDSRKDSSNGNSDGNSNGSAPTRMPGMEVTASVGHNPDHGIMQSYTLHLDEDKDLVLSSSHFYFSSMITSAVNGARTALSYSLTLVKR